jgi:hypothetical protein
MLNNVILNRLAIILVSAAVLTGLYLLGYLLLGAQAPHSSEHSAFMQHFLSAPLSWSYALLSALAFVAFLAWIPQQWPVWRLRAVYQRLDSSQLDENPELCQQFYRAALTFRVRYGEVRFVSQFLEQFTFFYHYHNDALRWINNLCNEFLPGPIPENFIIHSICSGRIGRIFSGMEYGGGLPSASVSFNEPVYLHARVDSLEVWSASSSKPISVLNRQPLELEAGRQFPDYLSCYLKGLDKATLKPRRMELRCRLRVGHNGQSEPESAMDLLDDLRFWIEQLGTPYYEESAVNFGIDVAEIDSHEQQALSSENPGTTQLQAQLQQLSGRYIDGYFYRTTLSLASPRIPLDAVVLCSGLGIVAITEFTLDGSISYSGEDYWTQISNGEIKQFENVCLPVLESRYELQDLMEHYGLDDWPIHSLVLFSHPSVILQHEFGKPWTQCDVISLAGLRNWFANKPANDTIRFTKDDYNRFIALLDPARLRVEQAVRA